MIEIGNLSLPVGGDMEQLYKKAAKALGISQRELGKLDIVRQSIDARKKSEVRWIYTVRTDLRGEQRLLELAPGKNLKLVTRQEYAFPRVTRTSKLPPVVVGMGPAGLFAALFLARNGLPPIVLERGRPVEQRAADVERFWATGILDTASNVQFGEGGAGTFSDGKLTTGTHDPRITAVMDTLVEAGAPADIKYSHKPHIGTDVLREVVRTVRQELISLGCNVRFEHRLTAIDHTGDQVTALHVASPQGEYVLPCDAVILAPGHSARDTFRMLRAMGVPMEKKSFAVGVRIEHDQQTVSHQQYGPAFTQLPPSDYKLSCHLPNGRAAYTFCVCPGGQVVAAASEEDRLVTNGMSLRARDGKNINGGLLVGVGPEDLPGDVLSGMEFQEEWEHRAYLLGGGGYTAPAQRVEDFLLARPSDGPGAVLPTYRPGVKWTQVDQALPDYVSAALRESLPLLDRKLHGFAAPDGVLTGIESRSSSPVRILRDGSGQSTLRGLYPCGEGAGYAGGIVSAAVDGIRIAEAAATQN